MVTVLVITGMLAGLAAAGILYSTQIKKSYLLELEKDLGISQFNLNAGLGKASISGVWKGCRIVIEAHPSGPSLPSCITYRMDQHSSFTAMIQPGQGVADDIKAKENKDKQEQDEKAVRPWRVKLTKEEQELIDQRRGGTSEEMPLAAREKLSISSPKPEQLKEYLAKDGHGDLLVDLFNKGVVSVEIDFAEIIMIRTPYTMADLAPKVVEDQLKKLRDLRVGTVNP